jgi:hypothetical protein
MIALEDELIGPDRTFFDYGCGKGGDVARLSQIGIRAHGWDPAFFPDNPKRPADVVNLGFVLNVIEEPRERVRVLHDAWSLAGHLLVVAARLAWESAGLQAVAYGDGVITRRGTFQKFFEHEELREWIEGVLDMRVVAAGPGVFYCFRDQAEAQHYLARQVTRDSAASALRVNERLFDANRELLEALARFVEEHVRLPSDAEIACGSTLVERFGSIRSAHAVVRMVTGQGAARSPRAREERFAENRDVLQDLLRYLSQHGRPPEADELHNASDVLSRFGSIGAAVRLVEAVLGRDQWDAVRRQRRDELLVFLALSAFGGRPKISKLPLVLQRDIRAAFGSYRRACEAADLLLFAAGNSADIDAACARSRIGKVTQEALYVHRSAVGLLAPLLRVYEGCGRVLAGSVPGSNIMKLSREEARISYLSYPTFDSEAHPPLRAAVTVSLPQLRLSYRSWSESSNPPILHRKELFVGPDYPGVEKFERLTRQEERAELLAGGFVIGTKRNWEEALASRGLVVRGHRLMVGK